MNSQPSPASYLLFLLFASTIHPKSSTKTINAYVCLATNQTALPKKIKMAPTTLPTI